MTIISPEAPTCTRIGARKGFHTLNAQPNLLDPDGAIQFHRNREAAEEYRRRPNIPNMKTFPSRAERPGWLVGNDYYGELVANPRVRTTNRARGFFKILDELQFDSGCPYALFEDTAKRANPLQRSINMPILCSEILQVNRLSHCVAMIGYEQVGRGISCNHGSLNIAQAFASPDFGVTVETALRALRSVSDRTEIDTVFLIAAADDASHAIGLGQIKLHGFLACQRIRYDGVEDIDSIDIYFLNVAYHALRAFDRIVIERGMTFAGFDTSAYADGTYFDDCTERDLRPATEGTRELFPEAGAAIPMWQDWSQLLESVRHHGICNAYMRATPPTGSISCVNNATASIHPIADKIEIRREGKLGRVDYPAPRMSDDHLEFFEDAYEVGYEKFIVTYAATTRHVDRGLSRTLFFLDTATARDINKARIHAWRVRIKTLYYIRLRQLALERTRIEG